MNLVVSGEPEEIAELIFCLQRLSYEDNALHQTEPSKSLEQKQLASIRKARNLTQAELARRIGVDQTAIHMWETGKTTPRLSHLKLLVKELDCSLDDLVSSSSDDKGA